MIHQKSQKVKGIPNGFGGICHVEAEYFYPGVWEKHGNDELTYTTIGRFQEMKTDTY